VGEGGAVITYVVLFEVVAPVAPLRTETKIECLFTVATVAGGVHGFIGPLS